MHTNLVVEIRTSTEALARLELQQSHTVTWPAKQTKSRILSREEVTLRVSSRLVILRSYGSMRHEGSMATQPEFPELRAVEPESF